MRVPSFPSLVVTLATFTATPLVAQAAPPAPAAAEPASAGGAHTVKKGDTLWDLARQYLKDPFLWPQLFKLNTDVVEDPHWIYPGEVLKLAAGADSATPSVPLTDTPSPAGPVAVQDTSDEEAAADALGPAAGGRTAREAGDGQLGFFRRAARPTAERDSIDFGTLRAARSVRPGEMRSSGFLTEGRPLASGRLIGRTTRPQIRALSPEEVMGPFTSVAVELPRGAAPKAGDTLLVARMGGLVNGLGEMVIPTGLVRVREVMGSRAVGEVIALYGRMVVDQVVLPLEPLPAVPAGAPRAVGDGLKAQVVGWPGVEELKDPQKVLYLDRGARDGVAVGDVFEVRSSTENSATALHPGEVLATVQVVRVGERHATTRILRVRLPDIAVGTEAVQVARITR